MILVARSTRRIRSLWESATIKSPSGARATPSGVSSWALMARPSSPENPLFPLPTTVDTDARRSNRSMTWLFESAKYRSPSLAIARPPGGAGQGAGAPRPREGRATPRRFTEHERSRTDPHDHDDENQSTAKAVGAEQRWCEQWDSGRTGPHRNHVLAERNPADRAAHESCRLSRPPGDHRDDRQREPCGHGSGQWPSPRHPGKRGDEDGGAKSDRGHDAESCRTQV